MRKILVASHQHHCKLGLTICRYSFWWHWGEHIFGSCNIALENMPTSRMPCSDSEIPCTYLLIQYASFLSCTCLYNDSKWCLPSIVSPSSCTALLLWCFLLGILQRETWKSTLCIKFSHKRRVGLYT